MGWKQQMLIMCLLPHDNHLEMPIVCKQYLPRHRHKNGHRDDPESGFSIPAMHFQSDPLPDMQTLYNNERCHYDPDLNSDSG